ncbi:MULTISPECIES: TIGR01621 family pseudouridine synthase [unclassified Paludibacterium]|uniref:TIGR01621 family pseudouridine synthase n=1 Tax=unclassified Paludibacterium TaxID=2618429 RepID=UPI001C04EFC2|nr:TIGR01621 family pseudouridine synthase [Paludibacterium sp. B53371]BEV73694.1 TIGR01621 family pseudouridine synthase [Paludibacterium sp. THUN1379]
MFRLVHEDPRFFLIDKQAGVSFHHQGEETGLVEAVRAGLGEVWPVHRLDRMTSGLLLLARSPDVARALSQQLAERQMDKLYLALSDRKPGKKQGLISGDMLKGRGGAWRLTSAQHQPARTRFLSTSLQPGIRLFFLKPLTGKTHQLRVAMKSLGAPILGDPLYHPASQPPVDRGYLHAWSLRFRLGEEVFDFECPPTEGEWFRLPALHALLTQADWRPANLRDRL